MQPDMPADSLSDELSILACSIMGKAHAGMACVMTEDFARYFLTLARRARHLERLIADAGLDWAEAPAEPSKVIALDMFRRRAQTAPAPIGGGDAA